MPFFFLAFVLTPIIEIGLFIEVGGLIGLWPTLAIVLLTAFAGTFLLRMQGLQVLRKAQSAMAAGEMPLDPVIHGLFLLVAGALLLTPGFATDAFGFLLFVPAVRSWIGSKIIKALMKSGNFQIYTNSNFEQGFHHPTRSEFTDPTDRTPNFDDQGDFVADNDDVADLSDVTGPANPDSPWNKDN